MDVSDKVEAAYAPQNAYGGISMTRYNPIQTRPDCNSRRFFRKANLSADESGFAIVILQLPLLIALALLLIGIVSIADGNYGTGLTFLGFSFVLLLPKSVRLSPSLGGIIAVVGIVLLILGVSLL
jgi:hypothetical protein